jgi:hypothetical protein
MHWESDRYRSCLVSIFIRFLAQKCKSAPKQAAFSPAFRHCTFVGRDEYTGATIPRKEAPAVRFQKICHVLLLAPESPAHFKSPPALDSSLICDSGALFGLPSPAQAPALAPKFATPVRRLVPVARDSRADPLSAARAGDPQHPWSIARLVLLHHLPDPAEMSP